MQTYPTRKTLMQYITTLNNEDLLSTRATCKSFYKLTSEELDRRIKPVFIENIKEFDVDNVSMFPNWRPKIAFIFDFNNPRSKDFMSSRYTSFQINLYDDRPGIVNKFRFHSLSQICNGSINVLYFNVEGMFHTIGLWERRMREAKLIVAFRGEDFADMEEDIYSELSFFSQENLMSQSDIERDINFIIARYIENHSVPICYALHSENMCFTRKKGVFVMFSGSGVEASTFLVKTTNEEELKEKLLEWKFELDFLESHHIISFHFTIDSMEPTNSEEIFSEIFSIQPVILRLSEHDLDETGLIYYNRTTEVKKNPGPVYAIVGYKKFAVQQ
uniref:F-box domain-containing protein n=2 Tax=Onchocerca TaxID=6281 RepID=A0A8R1TMR4_ONCVO